MDVFDLAEANYQAKLMNTQDHRMHSLSLLVKVISR